MAWKFIKFHTVPSSPPPSSLKFICIYSEEFREKIILIDLTFQGIEMWAHLCKNNSKICTRAWISSYQIKVSISNPIKLKFDVLSLIFSLFLTDKEWRRMRASHFEFFNFVILFLDLIWRWYTNDIRSKSTIMYLLTKKTPSKLFLKILSYFQILIKLNDEEPCNF